MELSAAGLQLIKQSEGFRAFTYNDVAGFPTIAYGHKLGKGESYPNGISPAQGDVLLASDVATAEVAVERLVTVPLAQGQFDALVDFVFNLGSSRLASSTLLEDLNAGRYSAACEQLLIWDHGMVNGAEQIVTGLKSRRQAEYNLWMGNAA